MSRQRAMHLLLMMFELIPISNIKALPTDKTRQNMLAVLDVLRWLVTFWLGPILTKGHLLEQHCTCYADHGIVP